MKRIIQCLMAALLLTGMSYKASATLLSIGDSRYLGLVEFGIPSGDQDREDYVNHLIGMTPNTSDSALGQDYERSGNYPPPLPKAEWAANGDNSGSYNVGGGYLYLFAKYDGPNYGSEVWYIGGLTGTIEIPTGAGGASNDKYGLSGVSFFNPGTSVPDGGATALLLGMALTGLGFIRKRI